MTKLLNKKADGTGISLEFLIRIVLVVVVIIALTYAGATLFGIFIPQKDQSTIRNFDQLATTIKNLGEDSTVSSYPLFIGDDYALIGYESDKNIIEGTCPSAGVTLSTTNTKPLQCGTGTEGCLCLCTKEDLFKDTCHTSESIICKTADDLGEDFSFTGGIYTDNTDSCTFVYIPGEDTPQTIFIERSDKTIRMCSTECSSESFVQKLIS
ncbi:MAG: hypothetical protein WC254_02185 [Candidatus Woesearchaeota archaeon]|jgi:hypothetical protein